IFATQGEDSTIKLWNTDTWTYKVVHAQFGNLLFSPDSKILGVISTSTVEFFDTSSATLRDSYSIDSTPKDYKPITSRMEGITALFAEIANINRVSLSFSNDGKLAAAEEHNSETGLYRVKVWNLESGNEVYALK